MLHSLLQGLRGAKKLKRSSLYLYVGNGVRAEVEAIGCFDLVLPNGLIIALDNCHYAPFITRGVVQFLVWLIRVLPNVLRISELSVSMNNMLYFNAITVNGIYETDIHVSKKGASYFITFTDDYSRYGYVYLLKHKHEVFETFKVWGCEAHVKRHTPKKLQQRSVKCIFVGYPKEAIGYYFYYPPENKIVVERYANFLEKDFILQKESGRIIVLEDEDILPFENTSDHPIEEESLAPIVSQEEDVIPVRRSVRIHKAPDRLCLNVKIDPDRLCFNVEVEEHNLGDLNEPANYKVALSNPKFEKWLVAMNAEMQSMYDNKV
uniref:Zinc finger, CCHC-type n=1 Tax=Tanacetum cinerariifolium TaxID=118510 RepID=A0A699KXV4_TANCI|nr:zinc finger, CCHC-type [Tanacetum cinerariifolium]